MKIFKSTSRRIGNDFCGCPQCGALKTHFFIQRPDGKEIFECDECGLGFLCPMPSPEIVASWYKKDYYTRSAFGDGGYFQAMENAYKSEEHSAFHLLDLIEDVTPLDGKRLLDVGCATGITLRIALDRGSSVEGVEPSEYAAQIARDNYGFQVHKGYLETLQLPENSYDIVTLLDVIEHVPDPVSFIKEVWRILTPNGLVAITTPNFRLGKVLGKDWIGFNQSLEHLLYFESGSCSRLFLQSGFKPIITTTRANVDALTILAQGNNEQKQKLAQRIRKFSYLGPVYVIARWFYRKWVAFDPKAGQRKGYGHQMLMVAQKTKSL